MRTRQNEGGCSFHATMTSVFGAEGEGNSRKGRRKGTIEAKLRQTIVELKKNEEVKKVATVVDLVSDDDDDDIAHDPEIRAMWKRGEHTCVMFDAPCAVCEKDDEEDEDEDEEEYDGEVRVMTEEEVQNDPEMTCN